ncbi:MAG: HYR domain-containing protein, partial [Bacteroidetes bacterium]|nr:HYR domain-containing protein [Bacteroidota bacterium]
CVEVTARVPDNFTATLQGWIDWDNSGTLDAGEELAFLGGATIGTDIDDQPFCFDVPADAQFNDGMVFARFRLSENGGLEVNGPDKYDENGAFALPAGEVEDHKDVLYKVGNYVWDDLNRDGLQDDFPSPCLDDVEMQLEWAGPDGDLATEADNESYTVSTTETGGVNGIYTFCGLIPGAYEISIPELPNGFVPTTTGAGSNPNFDSNDPAGTPFTINEGDVLPTGEDGVGDMPGAIGTFPDGQDNLSFDFGLVTEGFEVVCNCDGSITIDWEQFANGDSWTVVLEDEDGNPALNFVNMPETQVTIAPGSLNNGECYALAITENIGGVEVSSIQGFVHANCYPVPEVAIINAVGPSCPDSQDGTLEIDIAEQGCMATYDVYLTSQNSGEQLVGDDVMITGPIAVAGLGEDTYGVRLELVDRGNCAYGEGCFPLIEDDILFLQNTDTEPPTKVVMDASGAEPPMVINYGALPEGECGVAFTWRVMLDDNCLSAGVDLTASITASTTNPSVLPSAQVTVLDNEPAYAVEVYAAVGTNTLILTATDANGNENVMEYTINVADGRGPVVYCPSDMSVEIPACDDSAPVNWTVSAVDDCDLDVALTQTGGPASGSIFTPGSYTVSYEATDDSGNTGSCSFNIEVTQAPSPEPVVDVSGNGNYTIEHCEEDGFIVFSGNIYDCDLDAASFNPADLIVETLPLSPEAAGSLSISYTLPQDGYVYFEATGNLAAGTYLVVTTYQGVTVDHGVAVSQDPDQPAVMAMPGNLAYQAPDCEAEVPVSFAVQLSDDCDEGLGSASFTVNGAPAPPSDPAESDPANGLYVWNLNLSAGTYTLVGTYTDGAGNVTTEEATITVNGSEDEWAPIITYPSQQITEELDPCGPSEQEICFEATATDDCSGDINPQIVIEDSNGNAIPFTNTTGNTYCFTASPGSYNVTVTAEDAAGNSRTEGFGVTVTQGPPPAASLVCNDDINITVDENCAAGITADILLEGSFGCYTEDDFAITVTDAQGNPIAGPLPSGSYFYEVELVGPEDSPINFEP